MRAIRRILVAVKDPTAKSLPAVEKAAQLAKAFGAQLELFHGISSPLYIDVYSIRETVPEIERTTKSDCLTKLEKIAERLRARGLKVATSAEWDYPVYEAIVRRALRSKADLVVSERHAGLHIAPGLLRLTDWELLRLSPIPVLLVKTRGTYDKPVVLAAIDPGHAFSKPAKLDSEILRVGSQVTDALRGSLHAVHAYIPVGAFPYGAVDMATVDKLEAQANAEAQRRLDKALGKTAIPRKNRHLVGRHPVDAILQTAHQTQSDIVVMGAVARSGFKRLVIGNTAEGALDYLDCDLLIVKPKHFVTKMKNQRRGARIDVSPVIQGIY